jgi:hypothetical protein
MNPHTQSRILAKHIIHVTYLFKDSVGLARHFLFVYPLAYLTGLLVAGGRQGGPDGRRKDAAGPGSPKPFPCFKIACAWTLLWQANRDIQRNDLGDWLTVKQFVRRTADTPGDRPSIEIPGNDNPTFFTTVCSRYHIHGVDVSFNADEVIFVILPPE